MKSFSERTKSELANISNEKPCCTRGELLGMVMFGCAEKHESIKFISENTSAKKRFLLLCSLCGVSSDAKDASLQISRDSLNPVFKDSKSFDLNEFTHNPSLYVLSKHLGDCCKRAFLRGAFMGSGTVIDPQKNYNLEILCQNNQICDFTLDLLKSCGFDFKTVVRKSKHVLYIKSTGAIQDFLSYIGAYKSQMELINVTIEKEIRNDFVRSINSETANFDKTIGAAVRQIKAIDLIDKKIGIDNLDPDLKEIAKLRLKHKSLSLAELGKAMTPPLGKSGVNHRMKKIEEFAETLK